MNIRVKIVMMNINVEQEEDIREDALGEDWENNTGVGYEEYFEVVGATLYTEKQIAKSLSDVLENIVQTNSDREPLPSNFNATNIPTITIEAYLQRFALYSLVSPTTYILALIYIDKYHRRMGEGYFLHKRTVHRYDRLTPG